MLTLRTLTPTLGKVQFNPVLTSGQSFFTPVSLLTFTFPRDRKPCGILSARDCFATIQEKSVTAPKRAFSLVSGWTRNLNKAIGWWSWFIAHFNCQKKNKVQCVKMEEAFINWPRPEVICTTGYHCFSWLPLEWVKKNESHHRHVVIEKKNISFPIHKNSCNYQNETSLILIV